MLRLLLLTNLSQVGKSEASRNPRMPAEGTRTCNKVTVKIWKIARMVLPPAMRGDGAANALTNSPTPNCTPPEGTLASHNTTITWCY